MNLSVVNNGSGKIMMMVMIGYWKLQLGVINQR